MALQPPLRWTPAFVDIYKEAVLRFASGIRKADPLVSESGKTLLINLGITPQILFDFVEDHYPVEEVTAMVAVRRDYLHLIQQSVPSGIQIPEPKFPRKSDPLEGIEWLPRMILKAQCFLKGELPNDLMLGCSGDRSFCKRHRIDLIEFLHLAWAAGDSAHEKFPAWLRKRASEAA